MLIFLRHVRAQSMNVVMLISLRHMFCRGRKKRLSHQFHTNSLGWEEPVVPLSLSLLWELMKKGGMPNPYFSCLSVVDLGFMIYDLGFTNKEFQIDDM
ncbi:hypothetical protein ACH5RR_014146 [Cinchona calisaya]|uniref:Uncharacterized protein n=1 Tax=Cinchona calisaya TaxID=153742 RepID=A0ABD3A258_9GENT